MIASEKSTKQMLKLFTFYPILRENDHWIDSQAIYLNLEESIKKAYYKLSHYFCHP